MVVLLIVLTVVAFLAVEWYLLHRRRRATALAREWTPVAGAPTDLFFHPGHAWARFSSDGLVSVGTSDFASSFAGELASIEPPREGAVLHQGEPAWTLVSSKGRRLTQVMPVEGKVLAVNQDLLRDPSLAGRSPYDAGWILRVRPSRIREGLRNLLHGGSAKMWLDATRAKVTRMLSPSIGTLAHDGGEWAAGFGDLLGHEDWESIRRELFVGDDLDDRGQGKASVGGDGTTRVRRFERRG